MKWKKAVALLLIVVGLFGAGTLAFAQGDQGKAPWNLSFEQMLPFMQQMHPNLSGDQLKNMYDACHGPNGIMQNGFFSGQNIPWGNQ